ncbi:hypothetical protein LWI29_012685 [Acer saccharum]|uniref:RNase H type-1 domain-containing protein n=1 Tax=Acer saccharum TaxID=4024 RepID=A0AA39RDJ9_ACESA|nr:hypothetical protein LWI29_012685 [Acer saccharum]
MMSFLKETIQLLTGNRCAYRSRGKITIDKDQGESSSEGIPHQAGLRVSTELPGTRGEHLGSVTGQMEVEEDTFEEEMSEEERGGPAEELEEVVIDNSIPVPGEEWPPSACIWTLFVDGASNQHGCGASIVLVDPEGIETSHCIRFEFRAINNEAEYEALFVGLTAARELGAQFLAIKSDSQLIVKQVAGTYQAKGDNMSAYLEKVKQAIKAFQMIKMEQIPRGANHRADVLTKIATGGGQTPPRESSCSF